MSYVGAGDITNPLKYAPLPWFSCGRFNAFLSLKAKSFEWFEFLSQHLLAIVTYSFWESGTWEAAVKKKTKKSRGTQTVFLTMTTESTAIWTEILSICLFAGVCILIWCRCCRRTRTIVQTPWVIAPHSFDYCYSVGHGKSFCFRQPVTRAVMVIQEIPWTSTTIISWWSATI